jgi:NAD-dependent dihydropyrimidine dehydrogenase PreA subunit
MDIYNQLREHLDKYPVGYPQTQSKIEIKILKKLFTPEEARIACTLSQLPRPAKAIARKIQMELPELQAKLEDMARKGLIFRFRQENSTYFAGTMFAVGFYEYSLKRLDKELAEDYSKYFEEAFLDEFKKAKTPQMRVVPIEKSLSEKQRMEIMTFDAARQIIESQEIIAVADCICRKERELVDKSCGKSLETCLLFTPVAEYYIENKMGRQITQEEALQILKKNDEEGLVLSPVNAKNTTAMCSCCGCCCNVLKAVKRQEIPAEAVKSNYLAVIDLDSCTECETCIDRCQMDAIHMATGHAEIDPLKCIGCGLCVSTCSGEALQMELKKEIYEPPQNFRETYKMIAEETGRS